jgi:hypothetical protein
VCLGADGSVGTRERMETRGEGSRPRRVLIRKESLGLTVTGPSSTGISFTSNSTEKARTEAKRRLAIQNICISES